MEGLFPGVVGHLLVFSLSHKFLLMTLSHLFNTSGKSHVFEFFRNVSLFVSWAIVKQSSVLLEGNTLFSFTL